MKLLQNKLTREIGCLVCSFGKTPEKITVVECIDGKRGSKVWYYNSLADLNAEWEDAPEEPKEYWFIDPQGEVTWMHEEYEDEEDTKETKEIGNYFSSREEAEKAVRKLQAWKRLKDKGFRFECRYKPNYGEDFVIRCSLPKETLVVDVAEDLDLLFCPEVENE